MPTETMPATSAGPTVEEASAPAPPPAPPESEPRKIAGSGGFTLFADRKAGEIRIWYDASDRGGTVCLHLRAAQMAALRTALEHLEGA